MIMKSALVAATDLPFYEASGADGLGLDLTDVDFAFVGEGKPQPEGGTILSVNEQVVGPFKSVVAPRADEVRCRTRCVTYGLPGLLLFVR